MIGPDWLPPRAWRGAKAGAARSDEDWLATRCGAAGEARVDHAQAEEVRDDGTRQAFVK